jgi:hypothetical protein
VETSVGVIYEIFRRVQKLTDRCNQRLGNSRRRSGNSHSSITKNIRLVTSTEHIQVAMGFEE